MKSLLKIHDLEIITKESVIREESTVCAASNMIKHMYYLTGHESIPSLLSLRGKEVVWRRGFEESIDHCPGFE